MGQRTARLPDYGVLLPVVTILLVGLFMVFSASYYEAGVDYGDPYYFLKRQAVWAVLGLAGLYFFARLDYWELGRLARPALLLSFFLLVLVLVPGLGQISHGSRRWLGFGILSFQPSEAAKLGLVVFLASWLGADPRRVRSPARGLLPFLGLVGAACALILAQPDLGTAVSLAGTASVMLFAAGLPVGQLVACALAAVPLGAWLVIGEDYRRRRFLAFLDPWADPLGSGYHIIQALYALGSGGLFGVGFTQSRQKYFYLPERHTDFIYAIVGEELGFVGAAVLVILFALFAWRGYRVALRAPDRMGSLLAVGVTTMVVLQAVVNIGVVTDSLPITGITLPFVSFGGSSLVFSLCGVGILLNVSRHARR